jgi:hypothetical protein
MSVFTLSLACFPNPDVSKGRALSGEPVAGKLRKAPERNDRVGNAALVEVDRGMPVERTVLLRCKNTGGEDVADLAQTKLCRAAAAPNCAYFRRRGPVPRLRWRVRDCRTT